MKERLTPLQAIRKKCLDCMCGSKKEVRLCPIKDCPLYPYRFGKNPYHKGGKGRSKEEMKKISEILRKKRQKMGK